jgi:hypothetical protein
MRSHPILSKIKKTNSGKGQHEYEKVKKYYLQHISQHIFSMIPKMARKDMDPDPSRFTDARIRIRVRKKYLQIQRTWLLLHKETSMSQL